MFPLEKENCDFFKYGGLSVTSQRKSTSMLLWENRKKYGENRKNI